ncbi:hypothetical protein [uncultured Mycolicibacterium sp.]|uniref:hypothetical protein n=1 Tax=uncultured Mycolicibacterium sp. TaxID=2320817 RepID=UPI0026307897|nr:hypothetical protein [uncultured Mycolicibacterium sp.]
MAVYEVLTIALIVALATLTVAAVYLGLLTWFRALYVVRCRSCHHLTLASANQPQPSCPHCRHPVLLHPLYAVRHERRAPWAGDRLRY